MRPPPPNYLGFARSDFLLFYLISLQSGVAKEKASYGDLFANSSTLWGDIRGVPNLTYCRHEHPQV